MYSLKSSLPIITTCIARRIAACIFLLCSSISAWRNVYHLSHITSPLVGKRDQSLLEQRRHHRHGQPNSLMKHNRFVSSDDAGSSRHDSILEATSAADVNERAVDSSMESTYDDVANEILQLYNVHRKKQQEQQQLLLVGIAGPPGSGKSTLSSNVQQRLSVLLQQQQQSDVGADGCGVQVLPMDGYHFSRAALRRMHPQQPQQDAVMARRGAHWTFDADAFVAALQQLRQSQHGEFPAFEHGSGDPVAGAIRISNAQHGIVLVEGNYLLLDVSPWDRIRGLLDFCYFVNCDVATVKERVFRRHIGTGNSESQARSRVENNDGLNAQLVLQSKHRADRIIDSC